MKFLHVFIQGEHVGVVTQKTSGKLSFSYDTLNQPKWLSLSLPSTVMTHSHLGVNSFLQNLLPDNDATLSAWSKHFGVSKNPFALLEKMGMDCAGGVQFSAQEIVAVRGNLQSLAVPDVEIILKEAKRAAKYGTPSETGGAFSLAGAQAKTALFCHEDRWYMPSGDFPTTHIIKPAALFDGHAENEHFCMRVAEKLGLNVPKTSVYRFGEETSIVIQRYDRELIDQSTPLELASWKRLHQEDFCQALGYPPSKKYQNEEGPGVKHISGFLADSTSKKDTASFFGALVFNWLICGTDAHAKNYSVFLGEGGQYRLAPFYDIASLRPYDHVYKSSAKLSMKIGGTYLINEMNQKEWLKTSTSLGLSEDKAIQVLENMMEKFATAAEEVNQEISGKGLNDHFIEKLKNCLVSDIVTKKSILQKDYIYGSKRKF